MLIYANNYTVTENTLVSTPLELSAMESLTGIILEGNFTSIYENSIHDFYQGMSVMNGLGDIVSSNYIDNNSEGLTLSWSRPGYTGNSNTMLNIIQGNSISNCIDYAVNIQGFNNILIFGNNFLNNTKQAVNENQALGWPTTKDKWDNGTIGNYWSDYQTKYPKATEIGNTGIENIPYKLYTNNTDNYPLTQPTFNTKT